MHSPKPKGCRSLSCSLLPLLLEQLSDFKGFGMLSGKHDGKMLQAMPLLFTYTPVEKQQAQSSATGGFQQAGVISRPALILLLSFSRLRGEQSCIPGSVYLFELRTVAERRPDSSTRIMPAKYVSLRQWARLREPEGCF